MNYGFPGGTTELTDVTWSTTPEYDPGYQSNIFWSHQFGFNKGEGAYIGMRSNGGKPRTFLFSVWNATDTTTGVALKLGSIRNAATAISTGGMVDWTEYFEWNDPRANCYDQPGSAARFGLPVPTAARSRRRSPARAAVTTPASR
ncbi:hypothetical protein EV193_11295 [Herbihabitans rhizosphaerae]|uniref:Uncharacterized protein n=1 Tax=Herbihabitans rhizosphaerae TaxID=1872711 RepID=A0A4Q7KEF8_9PSEU|nr:hypothetical protein [Herbihabitans rhizosphaerae]RZS32461.1 hypothetical protein EV193_11295 [Herbihabitans rhizosphaerae]